MRSVVVGLFCALLTGLFSTSVAVGASIDAGQKAKGMAAAPALISATGLECQLSNAYMIDTQDDSKNHGQMTLYEVACSGSEGYVLVSHSKPGIPPDSYSCLEQMGSPGKCNLPENANPVAGLTPFVQKVNPGCQIAKARVLGHIPEDKQGVYEIACQNGDGFNMTASDPLTTAKPISLQPCIALAATSQKCTLTDQASQFARIDALAAQSGKTCQVKDRRYILTSDDGSNYYEVACQDGTGFVLQQAANGSLAKTIGCADADYVGGGCTLTNARQAQTEQAGLYTKFAQKAGFDCNVAKYAPLDAGLSGFEVVELSCSNRPDGAIGVFPASESQAGQILPCARSELDNYRCSLTPAATGYPLLTEDLKKLGKVTCTVSGSRIVGVTADKQGYIEVACADGGLGFMIKYAMATHTPTEAVGCVFASGIAGGCQLPSNQRHPAETTPPKRGS
jgi:hypothetical protein